MVSTHGTSPKSSHIGLRSLFTTDLITIGFMNIKLNARERERNGSDLLSNSAEVDVVSEHLL